MERTVTPEGRVGHADLEVAGGRFGVCDEWPTDGLFSPAKYGGSPCFLHLFAPDVDAFVSRAVAAGAKLELPIALQPGGDRMGLIRGPFGYAWFVGTPAHSK